MSFASVSPLAEIARIKVTQTSNVGNELLQVTGQTLKAIDRDDRRRQKGMHSKAQAARALMQVAEEACDAAGVPYVGGKVLNQRSSVLFNALNKATQLFDGITPDQGNPSDPSWTAQRNAARQVSETTEALARTLIISGVARAPRF